MGNLASQIVAEDGSVDLLYPCLSIVVFQVLCYTFCQLMKDNSYNDFGWSLTCVLPNAIIIGAKLSLGQPIDARTWAVNACLALWAVRLTWHFAARHVDEDFRYKGLRMRMSARGPCMYYILSFVFLFMFQAGLAIACTFTVMRVTISSSVQTFVTNGGVQNLVWSDYVGFAAFLVGLLIEWIADVHLNSHIANPDPSKGKYLKSGLWRYSRHPNYFGEALLWFGLWICSFAVPGGYATVFSPLTVTFVLRCVGGVPPLERKARLHPEWAQYEAETNCMIPWFWDKNAVAVQDDNFAKGEQPTEE